MRTITLQFKKLHDKAILPVKTPGNVGLDLSAVEDLTIQPGCGILISTGLAVAIPNGYALLLWDRSGLACKHVLHRLAGVIDSNYRGELKVCLYNLGQEPYHVKAGDRIVQAIIQEDIPAITEWVEELPESNRGEKGFGSSGR